MKMWKKVALLSAGTGVLFLVYVVLVITMLFDGMCGSRMDEAVSAPGNQRIAVKYRFDCGATTSFTTFVSIAPDTAGFPDIPDQWVLKAESAYTSSELSMEWTSPSNLTVSYNPNVLVTETRSPVDGVQVTFVKRDSVH
jgi:hypothetical protein